MIVDEDGLIVAASGGVNGVDASSGAPARVGLAFDEREP